MSEEPVLMFYAFAFLAPLVFVQSAALTASTRPSAAVVETLAGRWLQAIRAVSRIPLVGELAESWALNSPRVPRVEPHASSMRRIAGQMWFLSTLVRFIRAALEAERCPKQLNCRYRG
jgi:hypothetical protein